MFKVGDRVCWVGNKTHPKYGHKGTITKISSMILYKKEVTRYHWTGIQFENEWDFESQFVLEEVYNSTLWKALEEE